MVSQATGPLICYDGWMFSAIDVVRAVQHVGGDIDEARAALIGVGLSPEDAHAVTYHPGDSR